VRSQTPVKPVDIDLLVSLLIQYYDKLDSDTCALISLVKVYGPAKCNSRGLAPYTTM
jgi:hypothetical protein